jgi:hypothetical protein
MTTYLFRRRTSHELVGVYAHRAPLQLFESLRSDGYDPLECDFLALDAGEAVMLDSTPPELNGRASRRLCRTGLAWHPVSAFEDVSRAVTLQAARQLVRSATTEMGA